MKKFFDRKGISFVEVMITVLVLVSGFTGVYQAYLKSLNDLDYLTTRLYAGFLLDQKIDMLQEYFLTVEEIPPHLTRTMETVNMGRKERLVEFDAQLKPVGSLPNLLEVVLKATWLQNNRRVSVSRQAYLKK